MFIAALFTVFCLTVHVVSSDYTWDDWTAFDEYVNADDGYYGYEYLAEHRLNGVTVYVVNMTSQKWQDESLVSRPIWWHLMTIAIPDNLRYPEAGLMFIGGGSNSNPTPPGPDDLEVILMAVAANDTGQAAGLLKQIPNQPIVFSNDPTQRSRSEDRLIAWTWRTYVDSETPDPTLILRMPMTKGAKRGLDTIHNVAKDKVPSSHVNRFIVAGGSKRGWTTWSLACMDKRVVALAPQVFSMLNMLESLQNHFRNMNGGWSFAFAPYWDEDLTKEFFNPNIDGVFDVEDMYRYRSRLEGVPKLEMLSSGDEFFLCDDSIQWWNEMPGPKYFFMLPNAEHSMAPYYVKIYETVVSFWISVLESIPLPTLSWTMQETGLGGLIVFNTNPPPRNITGWSATTLDDGRRDFRLAARNPVNDSVELHPVRWYSDVNVVDFGGGLTWGAQVEKVSDRWVGFFIEATYDGPNSINDYVYRMIFTTQVNIVPYTWPRGPCVDSDDCYGYLV